MAAVGESAFQEDLDDWSAIGADSQVITASNGRQRHDDTVAIGG